MWNVFSAGFLSAFDEKGGYSREGAIKEIFPSSSNYLYRAYCRTSVPKIHLWNPLSIYPMGDRQESQPNVLGLDGLGGSMCRKMHLDILMTPLEIFKYISSDCRDLVP